MPEEYNEKVGFYNETLEYDLGGNMKALGRNSYINEQTTDKRIDSLAYTYHDNGFKTKKITDISIGGHTPQFKHFVDKNTTTEYTYDLAGRTLTDKNRKVHFHYNQLGLPRVISKDWSDYSMAFTYDAAGNKLQKQMSHYIQMADTSGNNWYETTTHEIDYIGNFLFEDGELKMIYHPEGVIRPTPANASNETDYVYDYFIKDYLGNVRVVLTEENATIDSTKFLATLEDVYRQIEINNFDNIDETSEALPPGYPVNGSVELNEKIALLSAANGTEIGPSMILPVQRGDKVSLSTEYFYSQDDQAETYDNFGLLVNEVLLALASSGAGILKLTEAQLIDIATGSGEYGAALSEFMSSNFDTTDVSKPHAYLIWVLYDNSMKLIPQGSGALRVTNPNELERLLQDEIPVIEDGYLHAYVANSSARPLSFDNFLVTHLRGNTRQINHYYPYGLSISGLGTSSDEYLNKYTSKELQTGEFDPAVSTGLEMFDFHARFYDPQLGRWFVPDPAEQFANPYLAMGNNPINGTDPNGEWFIADSWVIGFVHGFFSSGSNRFDNAWDQANLSASNDAKIIGGMFVTDENKHGFFQKTWEIVSRFTYQLPQTIAGYAGAQTANSLQKVNWVRHKYGATAVQTKGRWGGVTLGSYIIGDNTLEPNANNPLFQHEYGHYIQSQKMGFAFLPRVGIPSLLSAGGSGDHDFYITEQDANKRAFLYFNDNVADFKDDNSYTASDYRENKGWDFYRNPFQDGVGVKKPLSTGSSIMINYVDYANATQVNSLNAIQLNAKWYDYAGWFVGFPVTPIIIGIINSRQ